MAVVGYDDAIKILEPVAQGVNPFTGEVIRGDSLFDTPDLTRALHLAVRSLSRAIASDKRRKNLPSRAGAPWDTQEDELLTKLAKAGESEKDLALIFDRTRGAIRSRLLKLGIEEIAAEPRFKR